MRRAVVIFAFALSLAFAGCGGASVHPVDGVVVYSDGKPATDLKGFHVEFESVDTKIDGRTVSAVGTIGPDARFQLSTRSSKDGAVAGTHRVLIAQPIPVGDSAAKPFVIAPKYLSYQTSGLTATVEPKANSIQIEIERRK